MDRIEVVPVPGLEPEEAPARRTLDPLPVTMVVGRGPEDYDAAKASPVKRTFAPVTADFAAGELAGLVGSRCGNCVHFRKDLWEKTLSLWRQGGKARQRILDRFQSAIARTMCDGEPTLEVLKEAERYMTVSGGICAALSEVHGDVILVYQDGGCPEGFAGYKHRDKAARRESSKAFDAVMRAAQGQG